MSTVIRNHRLHSLQIDVISPNPVQVILRPGDNVISDRAKLEALAASAQFDVWRSIRWVAILKSATPPSVATWRSSSLAEAIDDLPPAA